MQWHFVRDNKPAIVVELNRCYWCSKTPSVALVTAITILTQLTNTVSYSAWVSATNLTSCYQLHFLSCVLFSTLLMWNDVLDIKVSMAYRQTDVWEDEGLGFRNPSFENLIKINVQKMLYCNTKSLWSNISKFGLLGA